MFRNLLGSLWRPVKETWSNNSSSRGLGSFQIPTAVQRSVLLLRVAKAVPPKTYSPSASVFGQTELAKALRNIFPGLSRAFANPILAPVRVCARPSPTFRTAPPFGRIFPSTRFAPRSGPGNPFGGGSRNYSTGFAQRAYQEGGQQATNAFNGLSGLKVVPGALADEVKAKDLSDDLKHRIRARAAGRKQRTVKKVAAPVTPARMNVSMQRALDSQPLHLGQAAGVAEEPKAAVLCTRSSMKKASRNLANLAAEKKQNEESVTLSMYLYGPPAWEMETIAGSGPCHITHPLISEIKSLGQLHKDHLMAVANVLEKLLQHGFDAIIVNEEDGGMYELNVAFPPHYSRNKCIDCLLVMGIDPCSPHFRLEFTKLESPESSAPPVSPPERAQSNDLFAFNAMSGSGFPWREHHSPTSSVTSASLSAQQQALRGSAREFLQMIDVMQISGHSSRPSFCD
ncbi:hypothetical protein DFJ77DRAFT_285095 [Powellomyces hirtus]|nr:hypothetical protein DFJ77DRAFT_285095 [Powellomyces hirtus]